MMGKNPFDPIRRSKINIIAYFEKKKEPRIHKKRNNMRYKPSNGYSKNNLINKFHESNLVKCKKIDGKFEIEFCKYYA